MRWPLVDCAAPTEVGGAREGSVAPYCLIAYGVQVLDTWSAARDVLLWLTIQLRSGF